MIWSECTEFLGHLVHKEYLAQLRVGYRYLVDYPNNRPTIISLRYFLD